MASFGSFSFAQTAYPAHPPLAVSGVSQDVMELFGSRRRRHRRAEKGSRRNTPISTTSRRRAGHFGCCTGRPQNTRRTKGEARRTIAGQTGAAEPPGVQRLAAWEARTVHREVRTQSAVHEQVARFAKERATGALAVLDDAAKRTAARIAVAERCFATVKAPVTSDISRAGAASWDWHPSYWPSPACSSPATSTSCKPGTPGRKKTNAASPKACPRKYGAGAGAATRIHRCHRTALARPAPPHARTPGRQDARTREQHHHQHP